MENSLTSSSNKNWVRLKPLSRSFYERDTITVSRELLGKVLIVSGNGGSGASMTAGRIVETEAYHGDDLASHCSRGETPRCAIMFGNPGVAYVYFIYGNYEMLNFVTEKKGYPGAVLIRAVEPVFGETLMEKRRRRQPRKLWTSGPGRLCRAMGIRMLHNGHSLEGPALFVADDGQRPSRILSSPRVGINAAKERMWRFFDGDSEFV